MQRRLTIGLGRELLTLHLRAQFDIVVNFTVRNQDSSARLVERLVAGLQIDDGETGLAQCHIPRRIGALAVRPTVTQGVDQSLQHTRICGRAIGSHDTCDSTHRQITRSKKL